MMQALRYFSAAVLALSSGLSAAAQQQTPAATPATGEATFLVFLSGREIGREQVSVSRTASGWTITATGRLAPPLDLTTNRFEITYAPDWQPIELRIDARMQNRSLTLATSFATTTAINEITQNGVTNTKNDQISARTVVIPNNFYGAYEALAIRLAGASPGTELPVYVAPQGEIRLRVNSVAVSTFETPAGTIPTRRYSVTFQNPGTPLDAEVTIDDRNRLARVDIGGGALSVARQDLAGVATRQLTVRNPTDSDARIPAAGFSLAATVTTPQAQAQAPGRGEERARHPAVVLIPGSGHLDRDSTVAGVPLFAQLAGGLAGKGFVVVRYDKRGVGQSGGRTETATLRDYADDAVAAVKWVGRRKDVDDRRIFVVGHSEGAAIAMLAAKEKRINALVLMAGMGTTGRELILEQQQHALNVAKVEEAQRAEKVELQQKILEAVVTEKGWEELPADVRPLVDTPWYRSLLLFDPARVMKDVRQPILILHGAADWQVPPHHAGKLAELARGRKNTPPVELKVLPGLTHAFLPAGTGSASGNGAEDARQISPEVVTAIAEWLSGIPRR
jgi:alpha-beta hydrolase superfamily lysophospholipase